MATVTLSAPRTSHTLELALKELHQAWKGAPVTLRVKKDKTLTTDGFRIVATDGGIEITSPGHTGILYGAYHLLRLQATVGVEAVMAQLPVEENPTYALRILNHWDNMDRTVERGYAGRSLWAWDELPGTIDDRYEAYARANASIGINGTVLNNVNASPQILTAENLQKVKALADVFRPYGLRVYLSVNFASPMVLGGLATADPLDKNVIRWWKAKVKEIYALIPDFGGFLVKANSEGQPGPCDYSRTHAEGANLLADALQPYKGIVMWRAFVYSADDADRAKQAYEEFQPLDGQFRDNVVIQVKNGPIDFQPREPYSPLFGTMEHTQLMAEFQITQEYLGQANHLVYLAPLWKEFFEMVPATSLKAVAGVANTGTDINWCGHHFAQANWYAFGRLAWNPALPSEAIAEEWIKQTFGKGGDLQAASGTADNGTTGNRTAGGGCAATGTTTIDNPVATLVQLMIESREAVVNYMMPLGLHHIFAWGHHYGPQPWCDIPGARPDWLPPYYHKAAKDGIGFDRTTQGSNYVSQYPEALATLYNDATTCPDAYLLWFHHLPWNYTMKSGRTLWDELCLHYDTGVRQVRSFQQTWDALEPYIDRERFAAVQSALKVQARDAVWWKDACLLYFRQFSCMPLPSGIERPIHELDALERVQLPVNNFECPSREMLDKYR
ncbi:MAG: alpha-glucuronidase [Prevotellaceae bacterium]|nr:alpha-glucuronidase [Prevotellaceae bacterium]